MKEETIYVETKKGREHVGQFNTIKALRNATGWGASKVYRLLNTKASEQKGLEWPRWDGNKGDLVVIYRGTRLGALAPADPDAQYVVTDGTRVYHGPASLEECQQMKKQIGFSTLKTQLWKTQ